MPHELFLTKRQATEIRNAFANNISTGIKRSKAQISKIIQSSGSFDPWLASSGKKVLKSVAIILHRDDLPGLGSNLSLIAINKFERKISEKGAVRVEKGFTLFILNEGVNDIIKIIKSLEGSNALTDGINETVKHEIKNKKGDFFLHC